MRLVQSVALVVGLILVVASIGTRGLAREIARRTSETKNQKRTATAAVVGGVVVGFEHGCKSKKRNFCDFFKKAGKKNTTLDDDDKRVVPTGPNPLHNR